jgi:hypothetical protein
MAKANKVAAQAAIVSDVAEAQQAVLAPIPRSAPREVAKAINFARSLVIAGEAAQSAQVVKTAKGTNVSKERVYGYDNGAGGGKVPTAAIIAIVADAKPPAGVTPGQWLLLQEYNGKTVSAAYDAKAIASRTIRRAYRAGAIRFVGA